ncbi:MAG TPA: protein jag [Enterococcus columbae]|nr:protein jag [Enterococcus columbae]
MAIYVGATVQEAIQIGLKDLNLAKEQVIIEILDEGKKGFLGMGRKNAQVKLTSKEASVVVEEVASVPEEKEVLAKVVVEETESVEATTEEVALPQENTDSLEEVTLENEGLDDEEALKKVALYLTQVTQKLGAPALVKMKREDGLIVFQLETKKQGILIGKHGKTLNALQYLVQVYVHRIATNKLSVVLNVGDYREKRQAILQRLADKTAEKVKRTGRPVFLEPMPAFERKQIHAALSKVSYVQTHSEGDEPFRYLVVEPVKTL